MATKEENQLLINEFVTRNVDAINTLESAKQKAVLDAIILIQNKFGTIQQSTFKEDIFKQKEEVKEPKIEEKIEFRLGDRFKRKNDILKVIGLRKGEFEAKNESMYLGWYSNETALKNIEDGSWVKLSRELPFKVGDVFTNSNNGKVRFEVLEIDDDKDIVKVKRTDAKGVVIDKDYEIEDFIVDIEAGFKVLIYDSSLPFKVGDKFYPKATSSTKDKKIIYIIKYIDTSKNYFEFEGGNVKFNTWTLEEAKERFENGEWELVKPLTFKVGDKFHVKGEPQKINTILEIDESKDYFELENDQGLRLNGFSLQEAKDNFEKGDWVLVQAQPQAQPQAPKFKFEIGDTFEQKGTTMQYTIIDIIEGFDQYVVQKNYLNYPTNINRNLFEEDVEKGYLVQIFVNQPFTSTTTTTTTLPSASASTSGTSGSSSISMSTNKEQEIKDLEDAIDTQKLLLTLADTKEEKDEIKELLKDLRAQLKKLKK